MAQDVFKPRGSTKSSQPDAGGANARTVPVFGIVKDNIDPTRSGRLQVYITDFGGDDPDNGDNWVSVSYMSPFYGYTTPDAGESGYGTYKDNPSSYGMWNSPPDIGTQVICIFVNGDMNYGYWIGCVPKPDALTMVPAIGATDNIVPNEGEAQSFGGAVRLPVTNINTNNDNIADSNDYINAPKPIHSYQASIMSQQGILRDPVRGPISSSAQRETPSRVGWGVSTPGRPIYEGGYDDETLVQNLENPNNDKSLRVVSRRGGHSIVMDDGDLIGRDQLIRIRTALGHQILMSDDGQTLMVLHSNGQSYIELGKEGTVDIYSTNSINLRTQGDLNLHADRNVNIHAAKEFNVQAENIKLNAEQEIGTRSGQDTKLYTLGNYTVKSDSAMSMESSGDSSFVSKNTTYINGDKVNLNTGATSTIPKEVEALPIIAHTDTLFDKTKGFAAAPGKLLSIVTRAPAHAPWANAGQGVDVKVDLGADSNLPASPSADTAAVNKVASTVGGTPVSVATTATMPTTSAISAALDKNTTGALLGASALSAATGPLSAAASTGTAIATVNGVKTLGVGAFAQSATQMVSANILKPGSDKLVNSLISSGANVTQALPSSLFTGKTGGENLTNYVNNVAVQAGAQVTNLQAAQTALTTGGVITGKESAGQVAGLVLAGASAGLGPTLSAVTQAAANPNAVLSGQANAAFKSINAGGLAAGVAQNVTGGLGGISKALNAMGTSPGLSGLLDSAKGVAGSAFSAITGSFKPMTAGIPQNLTQLAKQAAASTATAGAQSTQTSTSLLNSATGLVTGAATSALNSAVSSATGLAGASSVLNTNAGISALTRSATAVATGGMAAAASTLASGLGNLPGGQKTVQAVVNNATGALNSVPGASKIGDLAKTASAAALNKLPLPSIPGGLNSLTNLASTGLNAGAAAQLTSAISALSSGGGVPIKLPIVGFNTTDRGSITSQITSVLGDPKIPKPNLTGEISEGAKSAQQKEMDKIREQVEVGKEYMAALDKIAVARKAFYKAERELPQGDPGIDAAKKAWFDLTEAPDFLALRKKFESLKA